MFVLISTPFFYLWGSERLLKEQTSARFLTCFGLHREVGLSLENAVDDSGAVPIGRVVRICSCDLHHRSTWSIQIQLSSAQHQEEEQKHWFSWKTWMIFGFNHDLLKKHVLIIYMNITPRVNSEFNYVFMWQTSLFSCMQ